MAYNSGSISFPFFSDKEIQTFKLYFDFNEKHNSQINEELTLKLSDHPAWGPILKSQTLQEQKEQNARSLELLRTAIYEGKWEEYCIDLKIQCSFYAKMNIDYIDWYEIIKIYKEILVLLIEKDVDISKEMAIALMDGFSKLSDYAMYNIAEAYFEEKTNLQKSNYALKELTDFILKNTEDAIMSKDLKGVITHWNPSAEKMFGYLADDVVGRPGSILIPTSRQSEDIQFIEKLTRGETIEQFETERIKKDGTVIVVSISVLPVKNQRGDLIGISKVIRDITQQKKILQERNIFFENSIDMIGTAGFDGYFKSLSPAFSKTLGFSNEELFAKPFLEFIHPLDIDKTIKEMESISETKTTTSFVNRYLSKDGEYKWLQWNAVVVDELIYCIARDITQQKEITEERNLLFQSSVDMIGTAGFDGYFKSLNPAFSKTLGFTNEEIYAKPFLEFIHPLDIDKTLKEMELISQGHTTISFVNRYRCKDGEYKWFQWNAVKVDELMYCIARDITTQKLAEIEIISLNQNLEKMVKDRTSQLELANHELESFSYSVAHDLRSPLRGIIGYSSMLKEDYEDKLDSEGKRLLNEIAFNTKRMGQLIDDLLTFSKLGRKEMNKSIVKMNEIVTSSIMELTKDHETSAKINVSKLANPEADASLIKNVVTNLLSNAIKYSSKNKNAIINIDSEQKDNSYVYSVSDNGVGFDMAYSDKLFGVFQRLHSDEEFEGTGVGLAIVHRIILRHGGKVWAHGKEGEGATFYFSIPKN